MALRDIFRRSRQHGQGGSDGGSDTGSDTGSDGGSGQAAPDRDADPGSVSSQLDVEGRGPVTLSDRTAPGGQASPDTNQGKAEPMPATPGEADPTAAFPAPELGDMNVGAADPQTPSHPAARARDVEMSGLLAGGTVPSGPVNPGVAPADDRPGADTSSPTGTDLGPEVPLQTTPGRAQRQPGSLGGSPEEQETDVYAGAARMVPGHPPASSGPPDDQPGDAHGVIVPHELPAPGTSQEQGIVHGIRTPVSEDPASDQVLADPGHRDGTIDGVPGR